MTSWNDILAEEVISVKVFSEILAQSKYYESYNRDGAKVATPEMQSEIAFTKDYLCIHIYNGIRKDKIKAFSEVNGFEELEKTLLAMRSIIQSAEMYHKVTFETTDSLPYSESHKNTKLLEEEERFLTAHNDLNTSRRNIVLDIDPFEVAHWLSTTPKGLHFLPLTLLNTLNEHEQNVTHQQDSTPPPSEEEVTQSVKPKRRKKEVTRKEMADYCGESVDVVKNWETGRTPHPHDYPGRDNRSNAIIWGNSHKQSSAMKPERKALKNVSTGHNIDNYSVGYFDD